MEGFANSNDADGFRLLRFIWILILTVYSRGRVGTPSRQELSTSTPASTADWNYGPRRAIMQGRCVPNNHTSRFYACGEISIVMLAGVGVP